MFTGSEFLKTYFVLAEVSFINTVKITPKARLKGISKCLFFVENSTGKLQMLQAILIIKRKDEQTQTKGQKLKTAALCRK